MVPRFRALPGPQGRFHLDRILQAVGPAGVSAEDVSGSPGPGEETVGDLLGLLREGAFEALVVPAPDLPTRMDHDLAWRVVLDRMPPQTASVTATSPPVPLRDLPRGSGVGCATRREAALLAALHPDLVPVLLKGGVPAALAGVQGGTLAAALAPTWIVDGLAPAGVGFELLNRIIWVPQPGEGACVVVYRMDHEGLASVMDPLIRAATEGEVRAELAFLEAVEAPAETVVAASAVSYGPGLRLKGLLLDEAGARAVHSDRTGRLDAPEPLGLAVAADVVAQAAEVLA